MSEENGPAEPAGMVRPGNAWGVGILYGSACLIVPLVRMLGGAANLPGWLDGFPVGLLNVVLGYYWAAILRQVTRDERIDPAVFAIFFGICFAVDLAVGVALDSMRSTFLIALSHGTLVADFIGIWYLVIRVWNAAAGRNAPFTAKFAVGYLTIASIFILCSFGSISSESDENEPVVIALSILIVVLLFAGLQHLFNLGLRNSRFPEDPEDRRCPLWKAILQGVVVALGILAAIVLVFYIVAAVCHAANDSAGIP